MFLPVTSLVSALSAMLQEGTSAETPLYQTMCIIIAFFTTPLLSSTIVGIQYAHAHIQSRRYVFPRL